MAFQDDEDEETTTPADDAQDDAGADAGKDADGDGDGDGPADDDEDLVEATRRDQGLPAPSAGASASPQGAPASPPVDPKQQAMRDYLEQKYGKAADDSGVKEALAKSQRMNTIANVGDALETMARSRSQALGGPGADSAFYQGLKQQGAQGVAQAQASRQQQIQDFLAKNSLGRQAVNDQQTQALRQTQLDAVDPASRTSQVARAAFKATFPEIAGAMGDDFGNLSMKDLGEISKMTDVKAKIDAAKEAAKTNHDIRASLNQGKQDEKNKKQNLDFSKGFTADEKKHIAEVGKIDKTLDMVDQATKGGVASQLVPLEVAREIAGRLNPQEIAAAGGDPSTVAKLQRLWEKASDGTMTQKDAQEYRTLLNGYKTNLQTTRGKQRDVAIKGYARASGQPEDVVRGLVATADEAPAMAGGAAAGGPAPVRGAGVANAAPALKPGHQEGGYEFIGGDPGDKANWKKVGGK